MTPMPDTNQRASITTHGYRCAGKPAIYDAHAGHGPDESARPLCGMPVVPDESERPSCGVPVVPDESDSPLCGMPVMPDESRARASPGRCPSCHRVSCAGESPSRPVTCHAPAQHTPVADAANRCLRVVSHVNTVAFYRRSSGGAAKADRWAVKE